MIYIHLSCLCNQFKFILPALLDTNCSITNNGVDAFVRAENEEDVQDDAYTGDEHHRDDDNQQEPICTSTNNTWNRNFFCVDGCEVHFGDDYQTLTQHKQFGGGGTVVDP